MFYGGGAQMQRRILSFYSLGRSVSAGPLMIAACAVAMLGAILTACGGDSAESTPKKLTFIVPNTTQNFAKEIAAGYVSGVKQVGGVEAIIAGPVNNDAAKQVQDFEAARVATPGGIAVQATSPELFVGPLAAAAKDGIPLVAVNTAPASGSGVKLYVGNDNFELGRALAREVIQRLPANASGTVVLGTPIPGLPVLDLRTDGMRDEFARQLPAVKVIGPFETKIGAPANLAVWQDLVKANAGAIAMIGTGNSDGSNLAEIRKATGATWLAAGFDLDPRGLGAVKDGSLVALMSAEPFLNGAVAGKLQADRLVNKKPMPEGWILTPGLAVTSQNVDEIIARQASDETKLAWFSAQVDSLARDKAALKPLKEAR